MASITWTNVDLLMIESLRAKFSEVQNYPIKCILSIFTKWQLFDSGHSVLTQCGLVMSPQNLVNIDMLPVMCQANSCVNSLVPGRFEWNFRKIIFQLISVIDGWGIFCEIAPIWMPLELTDIKSTLVQAMAWCCQATSHYLSQCWPRSLSPYRPQWVNAALTHRHWLQSMTDFENENDFMIWNDFRHHY